MSIRLTALTTATILLAATGLSEARPDTRTMNCQQVQQLIQSKRAVVLTTGPDTYDRYVRQFGNECDWPQVPGGSVRLVTDASTPSG